ncbi:unnamed protein product [Phytomonas sp. Hart1]|nr:unnamed protein product [Phytomonas sp. Hart1]|eukprot:CCW70476.1 unnamed protein product [Phytomonas sp. isolate Hart1]
MASQNKNDKILVADLPMMWPKDFLRFEVEGGVWGQQMRQRRRQLTFSLSVGALSTVLGSMYTSLLRKNTIFVLFSTFSGFTILGFCIGIGSARILYEDVASNTETSMMRRVWWAKECAKHWDYSQVDAQTWNAKYPKVQCPKNAIQ